MEDNTLGDVSEDLRRLTEERVPDLSILIGEPMEFTNGLTRLLSPSLEDSLHEIV